MKLLTITVSYGQTQSLPEYSNVKPNLTLTAQLDEGDDPTAIEAALWDVARLHVHEQIDQALESSGLAAKYDQTSPRYQVLRTRRRDSYHERHLPQLPAIVVVLPNEITIEDKRLAQPYARETQRLRYAHALRVAAEYAHDQNAMLLDLSGGDLTPLWAALPTDPPPPEPRAAVASAAADVDPSEDEDFGEDDEDDE